MLYSLTNKAKPSLRILLLLANLENYNTNTLTYTSVLKKAVYFNYCCQLYSNDHNVKFNQIKVVKILHHAIINFTINVIL